MVTLKKSRKAMATERFLVAEHSEMKTRGEDVNPHGLQYKLIFSIF